MALVRYSVEGAKKGDVRFEWMDANGNNMVVKAHVRRSTASRGPYNPNRPYDYAATQQVAGKAGRPKNLHSGACNLKALSEVVKAAYKDSKAPTPTSSSTSSVSPS